MRFARPASVLSIEARGRAGLSQLSNITIIHGVGLG